MENSEFKQGLIIQKLGDNCVIDHFQNNKYSLFILIFFVMMIVLKYFVFDCMFNFVYENIGVSNPYDQIRAV
jgi:fatty-acid desaturase